MNLRIEIIETDTKESNKIKKLPNLIIMDLHPPK